MRQMSRVHNKLNTKHGIGSRDMDLEALYYTRLRSCIHNISFGHYNVHFK